MKSSRGEVPDGPFHRAKWPSLRDFGISDFSP